MGVFPAKNAEIPAKCSSGLSQVVLSMQLREVADGHAVCSTRDSTKVRAVRAGRANVAFADVQSFAAAALRHRLILSFEGQADGIGPDRIIEEVLRAVPTTDEFQA